MDWWSWAEQPVKNGRVPTRGDVIADALIFLGVGILGAGIYLAFGVVGGSEEMFLAGVVYVTVGVAMIAANKKRERLRAASRADREGAPSLLQEGDGEAGRAGDAGGCGS